MANKKKVRVAIIGVGNCASLLVQGVYYYRNAVDTDRIPGLMHVNLGGYHISDIEFTAAFDVVDTKVGKDLAEAIYAYPNNTYKFADVPRMDLPVYRGMTHDGLGKYLSQILKKAPGPIIAPASYFMKTPPKLFKDEVCREKTEAFILGEEK